MKLDLSRLESMHPALEHAPGMSALLREAGAVAFGRRYEPGVSLSARTFDGETSFEVFWDEVDAEAASMMSERRATERGAEATALAVCHQECRWTVIRVLQEGDHGDWLLQDLESGEEVCLEVSGTDDGDLAERMRQKIERVSDCWASRKAACVVRFLGPFLELREVEDAVD